MPKFNRIITLVLDSVGVGALPDSQKYNDDSSVNTIANISKMVGLNVPNLQNLGLGNIIPIRTVKEVQKPLANYGKMMLAGDGKDTLTGHWEMMGCTLTKGFKQFLEHGFDDKLIAEFERLTGRGVLANKEASGMKVIAEYYEEHIKTGKFILYTSVDSTFQLAAHEDVISVEELYQACKIARELTKVPEYNVARIIARPFIGDIDHRVRTTNRHDYAINPFEYTVMQKLIDQNYKSVAIGKINDIFNGVGVSKTISSKSNMDGIDTLINELKQDYSGQIFVNLVEFDSLYGHPRDVKGYKNCLEEFDGRLEEIINSLKEDDLLIITADHGNDPTYIGNNHTREYVPLLCYAKKLQGNNEISVCKTFEDLGETICENFNLKSPKYGKSFLAQLQ